MFRVRVSDSNRVEDIPKAHAERLKRITKRPSRPAVTWLS